MAPGESYTFQVRAVRTYTAVSYTHLDVYKRQVHGQLKGTGKAA